MDPKTMKRLQRLVSRRVRAYFDNPPDDERPTPDHLADDLHQCGLYAAAIAARHYRPGAQSVEKFVRPAVDSAIHRHASKWGRDSFGGLHMPKATDAASFLAHLRASIYAPEERVSRAVSRLPAKERWVVQSRLLSDDPLDRATLARVMNLSPKQLRALEARASTHLKKLLSA